MKLRVVVLGAGCGGLELTTLLSDALGEKLDLTLVDKSATFYFGFSKFEVMFGYKTCDDVCMAYRHINKPGVKFLQANVLEIDPATKKITTDKGELEAEVIVIALGAEYDVAATPGLLEGGFEFFSLEGAQKLQPIIPRFTKGKAIIGVTGVPFKCPPAPCEAALILHDYLVKRDLRKACEIDVVVPYHIPVHASIASSKAIIEAFAVKKINFIPQRFVKSIDPLRHRAILDNGVEMPFDLFMGIPVHRVPMVVERCGMAADGWIQIDKDTSLTVYDGIYAIGDITHSTSPKAGVFAEEAARLAAASILKSYMSKEMHVPSEDTGSCYIDFGDGAIGKVDASYRNHKPGKGKFTEPSVALGREKQVFRASREKRWFGIQVTEINAQVTETK